MKKQRVTKPGMKYNVLLACFFNPNAFQVLNNIFDHFLARELVLINLFCISASSYTTISIMRKIPHNDEMESLDAVSRAPHDLRMCGF